MNKRLWLAGFATLLLFPPLGWLILRFFDTDALYIMLRGEWHWSLQIILGLPIGFLIGWVAELLISRPFMEPVNDKYGRLISSLGIDKKGIIFLSFCAGFGEELLFRGALQPLMGIWITAFIFVAIHGYIHPKNWRITVYGIFMTFAIALLGYLTEWFGIFTACAAHMAIDIVLFNYLSKNENNEVYFETNDAA